MCSPFNRLGRNHHGETLSCNIKKIKSQDALWDKRAVNDTYYVPEITPIECHLIALSEAQPRNLLQGVTLKITPKVS